MSFRIAIGCSNYLYSEGLKKMLGDEPGIEVIGIFKAAPDRLLSIEEILKLDPEVIIADFSFDFDALLKLSDKALSDMPKILIIGDRNYRFFGSKQLKELVVKGIAGILPPSADSDLMKKALQAIHCGELWLDRNTLMKILHYMKNPEGNMALAKREQEVAFHICQGYRNKEIAQKLHISEQTVKSHCCKIYKKLGVSDRLQLALCSHKLFPSGSWPPYSNK
jgi:two-component system nitrate/nitrite response regulator NarL